MRTCRASSLTMSQSPASSSCGRSDRTRSVTTSAAGRLAGPVHVDQVALQPGARRPPQRRPAQRRGDHRWRACPPATPSTLAFDQRPEQPGDQHDGVDRRAAVADPQFQRGGRARGPDVEVHHAGVGDHPAGDQVGDQPVVFGRRAHGRGRPVVGQRCHTRVRTLE